MVGWLGGLLTLLYCVETSKDIFELFYRLAATPFCFKPYGNISAATPKWFPSAYL